MLSANSVLGNRRTVAEETTKAKVLCNRCRKRVAVNLHRRITRLEREAEHAEERAREAREKAEAAGKRAEELAQGHAPEGGLK